MNSKKYKLGIVLGSTTIALFAIWFVFLCLRFAIFQKSLTVSEGLLMLLRGVTDSFTDLTYHASLNTLLWRGAVWAVLFISFIFAINLVIELLTAKGKFLHILGIVSTLLSLVPAMDFLANSGNYFHYLNRFLKTQPNTFFAAGIIGFLGLGLLIIVLTVITYVLATTLDLSNEPKEIKEENVEELMKQYDGYSSEELSVKSRKDHQDIVKELDKQDDALCLVVIGGILLVTSLLFFILSFRRVKNKMSGIDPTSLQFFVFIACLAAAIVLLSIGLVRTFKTVVKRKQLRKDIAVIAKIKKDNSNLK